MRLLRGLRHTERLSAQTERMLTTAVLLLLQVRAAEERAALLAEQVEEEGALRAQVGCCCCAHEAVRVFADVSAGQAALWRVASAAS